MPPLPSCEPIQKVEAVYTCYQGGWGCCNARGRQIHYQTTRPLVMNQVRSVIEQILTLTTGISVEFLKRRVKTSRTVNE